MNQSDSPLIDDSKNELDPAFVAMKERLDAQHPPAFGQTQKKSSKKSSAKKDATAGSSKAFPLELWMTKFLRWWEGVTWRIKWVREWEVWIHWDESVGLWKKYIEKKEESIDYLILSYMDSLNLPRSLMGLRLAKTSIKADPLFCVSAEDLIDLHYIVLKNGVFDTKAQKFIAGFDAKYLTLYSIPRNYLGSQITTMPITWQKLLTAFDLGKGDYPEKGVKEHPIKTRPTEDRDIWVQWVINLIHFYPDDRIMPMLIGYPDAGKSPNIKVLKYMLGEDMVCNIRLNLVGKKGEVKGFLKPVWLQEESSMGFADNNTLQIIKSNYSDDSEVSIRLLFHDTFTIKGNKFMLGATNQCFRMSDEYNAIGTYKRLCPLLCPNRFKKDTAFEETIHDPIFLDELYTYLLNQSIKPAIGKWEQLAFQERNMNLWNWSAYPISHICEDHFMRDYDISSKLEETDVDKIILNEMDTQKLDIPKKFHLRIREAMEEMGVTHSRVKNAGWFTGVKTRVPDYFACLNQKVDDSN